MRAHLKTAQHYSHCFALKINQLPTKNSDRIALRILYPGMLFGLLLAALGVFDLFSAYLSDENSALSFSQQGVDTWFSPIFFDLVIFAVGIGIVFKLFAGYLCYRKIFFDGVNITIVDRAFGGKKTTYKEKLENYEGVQLRIEFFQFGFWNRNRYIIELRHKNLHKVAPLYISMNGRNIRKIWKDYAKKLNLPAIVFKNGDITKIDIEDLDKPIQTLAKEGKISNTFDINSPLPKETVLVRKRDKKVIKVSHVIWDAYNIILLAFLFMLWCGLFAFILSGRICPVSGFIFGAVLLWLTTLHFRRDKIAIKKDKLVIVHKFPLRNFKNDELFKKDIEAIEVTENPATGRSFLSIYSNSKMVIFGKKLSLQDLQWVRAFLINDIIK